MECVQPSLAAMPNGGVTVVWTYGGEFVEVEIDPSGAARALVNVRRDSLIEVEFDLTDHPPQFGEWLAQLVSGVGIARILAPAIAAA